MSSLGDLFEETFFSLANLANMGIFPQTAQRPYNEWDSVLTSTIDVMSVSRHHQLVGLGLGHQASLVQRVAIQTAV